MVAHLGPFVPGYIFAELDPAISRWRSVDSTFGVRCIVKSGELPAPLPQGIEETFMEMADASGRATFSSRLRTGEIVNFVSGPFSGLMGTLERLTDAGRVTVLLDLLGGKTPTGGNTTEVIPVSGV